MKKRVNKTKPEITNDIIQTQDATRRRALIRDVIFPHIVEINENVGYTKVYLQAMSGLINGEFDEMRKTYTIGNIHDRLVIKLDSIFNKKDKEQKKEYDRYLGLINKIQDVSVQDFAYASELPRYIDGFITKNSDKTSISTIDIDKILG